MIQGSFSQHLGDKTVVLGVSGSVAAVETVRLARELRRHGAVVKPVATESATEIVGEGALQWACGEEVLTGLGGADHVELSDEDILLVAPATANTVAKMANGIADNALTSVAAAFEEERTLVAPAMHLELYERDALRENLDRLRERGVTVVPPNVEEGAAKLPVVGELVARVKRETRPNDLDKRIVVTAGTTAEPLDDVRIISTRASGRTGVALAREAFERGADVTLIYGRGSVDAPSWIRTLRVETAAEMTEAALEAMEDADALVSAAAMSDHAGERFEGKLPSDETLEVEMETIPKMVRQVKERFPHVEVFIFKAESRVTDEEMVAAAAERLAEGMDLVVVNDVSREDAGFESEENEVILVAEDSEDKVRARKEKIAEKVLDRLV